MDECQNASPCHSTNCTLFSPCPIVPSNLGISLVRYPILVSIIYVHRLDSAPHAAASAWIGWFPLLFNTTEFIAELHRRSHPELSTEVAMAEGTRLGSRAMFYNAVLSLAANVVMPLFVAEAKSRKSVQDKLAMAPQTMWVRWFNKLKVHLTSLWAVSHLLVAICMAATL